MSDHEPAPRDVSSAQPDSDALLARYTRQLAICTFLLMIAAVLSLLCTGWIALSTKDLRDFAEVQAEDLKAQIKMTHDAVVAATRQAEAAETANSQTLDSIRRQLRAEVAVIGTQPNHSFTENMFIRVLFRNVGQTSAYEMVEYSSEDIIPLVDYGRPPFAFPDKLDPNEHPPTVTMGAGIEFGRQPPPAQKKQYSIRDLSEFKSGQKVYLVWGVVYYKDYALAEHFLQYCRYYEAGNLDVFFDCPTHNNSN
jgi:hypothetical protein